MTSSDIERRGRRVPFLLSMGAILASYGLAGCDGGLSTQEAAVRCDIERENKPTLTDEAYQACIACFEVCGDDCKPQATTPPTYECED